MQRRAEPLWDAIRDARERLARVGIAHDEAELNAELLAMHALGWDRAALVARWREPAPPGFVERYAPLVERRETREPAAYILGTREFYDRPFETTSAVLVPRPETEGLVDAVLEIVARRPGEPRVLDVGTGSGCIAVTLALECPRARVVATDISSAALAVARRNATRLGAARVSFIQGSLLETVAQPRHGASGSPAPVDVVVSNPPYVPFRDRDTLPLEVRHFEPAAALFGGDDGLAVIRRLIPQAAGVLGSGGWLVFELGVGQAEQVRALAKADAWRLHALGADLQGIPRIAVLQRR